MKELVCGKEESCWALGDAGINLLEPKEKTPLKEGGLQKFGGGWTGKNHKRSEEHPSLRIK